MRLPITIETIVFRKNKSKYSFLLLKRIKKRGGFWQFLTGGLEDTDKSHIGCAKREFQEELGLDVKVIKEIIEDMPHFEFVGDFKDKKKTTFKEYVFGFEVDEKLKFEHIENDEHEDLKWCSFEECISLLHFENNKDALRNLIKRLK
ncbi:NUDIX domain-containing protein [Nanoarchaeota archaeon]